MKDINNIIKRLLSLSELILEEMDCLENLSYYDRENTPDFDKHIDMVSNYLYQEKVIINNLSVDELKAIYNRLPNYDNDTDEFDRCSVNISDKLNEFLDNSDEYLMDTTDTVDDRLEVDDILDKYNMDIDISIKDTMNIIDSLATIVIKKMLSHIDNTFTDNKNDYKYKQRLMRYFKRFKYYYFKLDINLEYLGVKYRFDIDKIPTPLDIKIEYGNLSNNECITLLDRLYAFKNDDYNLENMSFSLFNMLLFDEFLNNLSDESLSNLIELCYDLEKKYGHSMYGDIACKKLEKKKLEIN